LSAAILIKDHQILELYQAGQQMLARMPRSEEPLNSQIFRGISPHYWEGQISGSCDRHMDVFKRFNAIPGYCFNCYKVVVEPRTVVELMKLMVVFHLYKFPDKNTRKCIIELREQVPGFYKGFVYCTGLEAGQKMLRVIRSFVSENISTHVPVLLKRGCTEYAQAFPEYSPADANFAMQYREEWQKYEEIVDRERLQLVESRDFESYDTATWTAEDARTMYGWLCYAAMIGDQSYLKISGKALPTEANISRPFRFSPPENEPGVSEP